MRFLLGLIVGAAMTLGVATLVEGHTNELVSEARDLWNDLRREADELMEAQRSPSPESLPADESDLDTEEPIVEMAPVPAFEPIPTLASAPQIPTPDPLELSDVRSGTESVWTPFHSERSANGFAEVLTRETGHKFSIDRRGPGEYQVMFAYTDESEKVELLGLIASVTGSH